ncbi:MAG: arginase family protein [Candidatus Thorarchaeota archaeon]|jgi:arginase
MKITIIGVPFNGDGTAPEIENPAQSFRDEGLISLLMDKGHHVSDMGDLAIPSCTNKRDSTTKVLNFDAWRDVSLGLSKALVDVLDKDVFPIVLGGDCSILMGIFDAFKVREFPLNLFFLDGHADFHDTDTSPTNEPADMELAALTGYLPKEIVTITGRGPLLDEENVVVYGINEYELIETSNIVVIDRASILENGITPTFYRSLSSLKDPNLPMWLHFDVDVLDKKIMPGVHYPVEDGLSYDEVLEFLLLVRKSSKLIGISIACYHPKFDNDKKGIKALLSLFGEIFEQKES